MVFSMLSVENKLCQLNGINDCITLINTHVTGRNLINEDYFVVIVTELELDIPQI